MEDKMRKWLIIIFALCFLLTFLCGCIAQVQPNGYYYPGYYGYPDYQLHYYDYGYSHGYHYYYRLGGH